MVGVLFILGLALIPILYAVAYSKEHTPKVHRQITNGNIDFMSGVEFEQYLKMLMKSRGYEVSDTPVSGDLGVDLIASRDGEITAIQVKRYASRVSRRAVSDAVAGIDYYGCDNAMVITNNYFTPGAVTLAQSNGCILIDRDNLATWVNEYQESILILNNQKLIDNNKKNTAITQPTHVIASPPKIQEKGNQIKLFNWKMGKGEFILLIILLVLACCLALGIFNYLWTNY